MAAAPLIVNIYQSVYFIWNPAILTHTDMCGQTHMSAPTPSNNYLICHQVTFLPLPNGFIDFSLFSFWPVYWEQTQLIVATGWSIQNGW